MLLEFVLSSQGNSEESALIRDVTNVARVFSEESFSDAQENDVRSLVGPDPTFIDVNEIKAILEQPC